MLSTKTAHVSSDILEYIQEFEKQSANPPGKDKIIGYCYEAFLELLKEPEILYFTGEIIKKRDITSSHFVNLFFRAIQYIELFHLKNEQYPSFYVSVFQWKKELNLIMTQHSDVLEGILLNKDTTTTIYQRYAGAKIILNALFPKKKLIVADFGCGGNYGLSGFTKNIEFSDIIDKTKHLAASNFLEQPIVISEGLSIDKEDPENPASKAWRLACSFYPNELSRSAGMLILEAEISNVKNVKFLQHDLTSEGFKNKKIPYRHFDAVIMSTFLYQLNVLQQNTVIEFAKKLLNKNGILIVQDFARKNSKNKTQAMMISNWFSRPYLYRTFITGKRTNWEIKEILRWESGRCKQVRAGVDFKYLLKH